METLRNGEGENIQSSLQETASRPVKKKKKAVAKNPAEGSHLANATTGGAPTALNVTSSRQSEPLSSTVSTSNASSQPASTSGSTSAAPKKMKKKKIVPVSTGEMDQNVESRPNYASDSDGWSEQSSASDRPRNFNTRTAGLLTKKPSTVREDREAEELEERGMTTVQGNGQLVPNGKLASKPAAAPANTSKKFTDSRQHTRSSSQPSPSLGPHDPNPPAMPSLGASAINGRGGAAVRGARHQSLSPARSAHFSSQLQTPEGIRHNPLPRSVSPAKSALKHSPSSRGASPVGNMPGAWRGVHGSAPSEASDTTSVISEDGGRLPKTKKSVRVSFDDDSVIVGRGASPPTSPDSPMLLSPQNKDTPKKGWFRGRDKKSVAQEATVDPEVDDVMKPTPTLPSFGSVRGRNVKDDSQDASQTSWAENALARMDMSSDHAVGSMISQDLPNKQAGLASDAKITLNEPLPPVVTSVEGTGDNSDTDGSVYSVHGEEEKRLRDESVPSIAVQPATPGLEESQRSEEWSPMPGGYRNSIDSENRDSAAAAGSPVVEHHPTDPTPASIGIAEPEPTATIAADHPSPPPIGGVAEGLRHQIEPKDDSESDDTNGSIYSDAAEDLSDIEGDGFGSINAIVESPALPALNSPVLGISTPPDSPSVRLPETRMTPLSPLVRQESELSEPGPDEGWDRAQAYWSGLSQSRKQQIEEDSGSGATKRILEEPPKPKKKKKVVPRQTGQQRNSAQAPLPPWPDRQYREEIVRSSSPTAPQMKKSMRGAPAKKAEEPHMRVSMREGQPLKSALSANSPRNSAQPPSPAEPKGTLQKKTRPVSAVAMVDYNKVPSKSTVGHKQGALTAVVPQPAKKSPSPTKVAAMKAAAPKPVAPKSNLRRTMSNGSDSSSSFKKARSATSDAGRKSMKRTMRGSSVSERPTSPQPNRSGAFSLRSSSPSGSTTGRRPFSSSGQSMRTSMRESSEAGPRVKSPTRSFGFGSRSKPTPTPVKANKSRFLSKFGDSSDEEDGGGTYRSSRFADSSDEDEPTPTRVPANLTPVRGIPKRIDEGDSTDLEDSEIEKSSRIPMETMPAPAVAKLEGVALATGSLRATGPGMDLQKQDMGTGLQAKKAAEKDKKKGSFFGLLGKKKDDSKVMKADIESAARRDTPLERSKTERDLIPSSPASPSQPVRPSGKLQRRNTPKRYSSFGASDTPAWPLGPIPPMPGAATDVRPTTSDGVVGNGRPDMGTRQSTTLTTMTEGAQNGAVVSAKSGKKKKFLTLRKALGLHD